MIVTVKCAIAAGVIFTAPPEWNVVSVQPGQCLAGICYAVDGGCEKADAAVRQTFVTLSREVNAADGFMLPAGCQNAEQKVQP